MEVLDRHFAEFMDLGFTAQMDETLDEVASGDEDSRRYLKRFFLGSDGQPGLHDAVKERKQTIPFPAYEVGRHPETDEPVLVRIGKNGEPLMQLGDPANKRFASVPDDLAPADLDLEKALELFDARRPEAEVLGVHPDSGRKLLLRNSRGFYLEVEPSPEEAESKNRTFVSLPPNTDPHSLSQQDLDLLCRLPREIGQHPDSKEPIVFRIAKYGPVLQCGKEYRNVEDWRQGVQMGLDEALTLLAAPKETSGRKAIGPIQELGELPGAEGPVRVMSGRFGPYVTDGTTNATLPKGKDPATLTPDEAIELLQKKKAAGPSTGKRRFVKRKKK
jgi:DNA topoisomerase-1